MLRSQRLRRGSQQISSGSHPRWPQSIERKIAVATTTKTFSASLRLCGAVVLLLLPLRLKWRSFVRRSSLELLC